MLKRISFLRIVFLTALLFYLPQLTSAQMFSVDSDPRGQINWLSTSSLSAGVQISDFSFTGDPQDISGPGFDYNYPLFRLSMEMPGLDFYIGLGGSLTGMGNHSVVNIGANLSNEFVLKRSENFVLTLPLVINTDLKRVQRDDLTNEFQQSLFTIGTGLVFRYRPVENMSVFIKTYPSYGFSFSQGSFFGGTVFQVNGKLRAVLHNVFRNNGIIFGYDFLYRRYDIDGNEYDYDFSGNSITLGITF